MADEHAKKGLSSVAKSYKDKTEAIEVHLDRMKEVLFASQKL
jgi:hypothetical protein